MLASVKSREKALPLFINLKKIIENDVDSENSLQSLYKLIQVSYKRRNRNF